MDKRVIFPTNDPSARERNTFFVNEDQKYLVKKADNYHPEIQKYISEAKPIKDLVQVLLTALGAYEFWGQNVNGDRFRRAPLSSTRPDYGYKTFLTNANYFTHHVNKDPNLAKGKVLAAVWNDRAKRVELVVGIDINKDPEAIAEIDSGRPLSFSMGCRTPYDVCTICGNKAKNRNEYCDHAKYMMNQIDHKSGELVGVDNPFPKFCDISRVLIPADKTAYMWAKIASADNPFHGVPSAYVAEVAGQPDMLEKVAAYKLEHALTKKSSMSRIAMVKRIALPPQTAKIVDRAVPFVDEMSHRMAPKLPKEALDKLAEMPLEQVLSSFSALGMEPTKEEFDRLVVRFIINNKDSLPEKTAEVDELIGGMYHQDNINDSIVEALAPLAPYRSIYKPFLMKRAMYIRDKLREGDAEMLKHAQEARELLFDKPAHMKGTAITAGTVAGLVAMMYAIASQHGTGGIGGMVGDFIKKNPFLAIALGAAAYKGLASLKKPSDTGIYDVDDPNREPYNINWQSRFARLQARPVTVIKTAAKKPVDKALAYKALGGPVALFGASRLAKAKREADPHNAGPVSKIVADHPQDLYAGLMLEHVMGKPISGRIAKALESSSRVIKHASIEDKQFLELLPDEDYGIVSDLVILKAVKEIDDFLGGN